MNTVIRKIYALWDDDIEAMAADLNVSATWLARMRAKGQIPGRKYDHLFLRIAAHAGRRLTQAQLDEARADPEQKVARRKLIGDFYASAGGIDAVAKATGVSPAHLYANKSRGWLNITKRHEYLALAKKARFPLPEDIFKAPI